MELECSAIESVKTNILSRIADLRKDTDAKDVTFVLGKNEESTKEVQANSTILSMSSPYFRAMFYGPMREPTSKRLPDIEAPVFEKLLDYVHGYEKCLDIKDADMAWELKYAAKQFLMPDLEAVADSYLRKHMNFSNSLDFLRKATEYGAHDFKASVFKTIKHHGQFVLETEDLGYLLKDELIEILRLFSKVQADIVFDAVLKWSKQVEDKTEFMTFLHSTIFSEIKWEKMSRDYFCSNVYGTGLLSMELENKAMYQILSSPLIPEDHLDPDYVLRLSLKLSSTDSMPPFFPQVDRLFVRTTEADFVPNIGPTLTAKIFARDICVEPNGIGKLIRGSFTLDEEITGYDIAESEVEVFYRMHGDPTHFQAANVKVKAFRVRMPTSRVSFVFEINFDPIQIVPEQNEYYKGAITAALHLEVDVKRSVLLDLQEDLLLGAPKANPFFPKPGGNGCNVRGKVLSWSTSSGEYKILQPEKLRSGGPPSQRSPLPSLEWVKDHTEHVPFICQIN